MIRNTNFYELNHALFANLGYLQLEGRIFQHLKSRGEIGKQRRNWKLQWRDVLLFSQHNFDMDENSITRKQLSIWSNIILTYPPLLSFPEVDQEVSNLLYSLLPSASQFIPLYLCIDVFTFCLVDNQIIHILPRLSSHTKTGFNWQIDVISFR